MKITLLLSALTCLFFAQETWASTPSETAVLERLHALKASGVIDQDATLRLQIKQGNRASFLGRNQELRQQWEEATGVVLDVQLMPQGPAAEQLESTANVDLMVARNDEYPELYLRELILPLDSLLQEVGFKLNADEDFFLFDAQSSFAGSTLALPADGDLLLLYLRKDLLQDPQQQKAFAERYGYALAPPETWQEYEDQLAFFHRPEELLYGTVELRDPELAWMHWLPRFTSQAFPNQYLFDDQMQPQIDSREGLEATRSYLATLAYSPEFIAQPATGYDLALPYFAQGKAYSLMITVAGAKLFNRSGQAITDNYSVHPLPGQRHSEGLVVRSPLAFGNNLVIPATSQQPELALLYALWLTSKEISPKVVRNPGGFVDPFRYSHLEDERIRQVYGGDRVDTLQASLDFALPAGIGLPRSDEFLHQLSKALGQASQGQITAQEAVNQVQLAWEQLVEEAGPDRLLPFWLQHQSLYPSKER